MKRYRVRDWERLYETHDTRKLKHLTWVAVPVHRDGEGYGILLDGEHGACNLGAWLAILQVASTSVPRGTLCRGDGRPLDEVSMEFMTKVSRDHFARVFPILCSSRVGWMEWEETPEPTGIAGESPATPRNLPESRENAGESPARIELNRTERSNTGLSAGSVDNLVIIGTGKIRKSILGALSLKFGEYRARLLCFRARNKDDPTAWIAGGMDDGGYAWIAFRQWEAKVFGDAGVETIGNILRRAANGSNE
jgi:hypothetical protein